MKDFLEFVYSLEGQTILATLRQPADARRHRGEGARRPRPALQVAIDAIGGGQDALHAAVQRPDQQRQRARGSSFTNEVIFGDDVDGAFAKAQAAMQSIIDTGAVTNPPAGEARLPAATRSCP